MPFAELLTVIALISVQPDNSIGVVRTNGLTGTPALADATVVVPSGRLSAHAPFGIGPRRFRELSTDSTRKVAVSYTLTVDTADLSSFQVLMRVRGAPARFTIAAAAHPEYDDRYWRYLEGLRVDGGEVEAIDSVRWSIRAPAGEAVMRYRIRPPVVQGLRAAWRAFLTPYGGLVGGPHSFLYVAGEEAAAADVTLRIPDGWRAITTLDSTAGTGRFMARSIAELMDSPILIGPGIRVSRFAVDGVPHDIGYWGTPAGTPFDTTAFLAGIERLTRQIVGFWGRMPYRRFVFMFEDGANGGGLEHSNSVTLGAQSAELAKNADATIAEVAHEFFHAWNLMYIRPAVYRDDVDYRVQPPVPELWFSEGLTMFYADLLLRRASLPVVHPTRADHLALLIGRYLSNSGNWRFSAEQISRTAYNAPVGALGDFSGSAHLQGELIGGMLDMIVRDATDGARSMDDVMRLLLERRSPRGFRDDDIESAVEAVCGCDVTPFFDAHVRSAHPIDFARWLALAGLRPVVTRTPATRDDGRLAVDPRISVRQSAPGDTLRLVLWVPDASWVNAGLHTNDRLLAINGQRVETPAQAQAMLGRLQIGDPVRFDIVRDGEPRTVVTRATSYEAVSVRVEDLPDATGKQKRLREAWKTGR